MRRIEDFRQLKDQELLGKLGEMREELFTLRFKHAMGRLDNSARLGQVKRDIARLSTLVREREIAADEESQVKTKVGGK